MASTAQNSIKVLLLTKTCGYRHDCIPTMISAFNSLPFSVTATEDSTELLSLSGYDVVALGHNTGDYLTEEEVTSLLNFVENGSSVVGIHAATSSLKTNTRYTKILGEVFNGHPPPQWMTLAVENPDHYINGVTSSEAVSVVRRGVYLQISPAYRRPHYLTFSAQEDNEEGAESAGFPLSWTQTVGKGRVYYTALGHFDEAYKDTWFMESLRRAVVWTAKKD
ncbi:hypothetical protein H9Q74_008576 [Fusarium xylarioides]|nr:hypothetical protein H9Q71_008966 [Fusarium xylarioides]KAG5820940.1 hypothetical protein H9Q74_008576 [Fusarium xylarioides]